MYKIYKFILKYESNTFLDFINDNNAKNNNKSDLKMNDNYIKLLKKENEEYKNKINELEKKIKELEINLHGKDNIIKEEKIKNNILNNKILELEKEIKLLNSYFLPNGEKLLSIKIISTDQKIDLPIIIKNTEYFSKIEQILYEKYPKYTETENYFLVNGSRINRLKTLEQNGIKNNATLTLVRNDI